MKNPTVAGAISTGAALKSHGRWYCRNPYTNSVQTVMRHSYVEITPATGGFFIFVGFFFTNFLKTLFVMGLGPGSDSEQFPVGYTARNRAKIMCFQWISNQNQWFSIDFLVRTLLQE